MKKLQLYIPFLDLTYNNAFSIDVYKNEITSVQLSTETLLNACRANNLTVFIEGHSGGDDLWLVSKACECGCAGQCFCEEECPHHDYILVSCGEDLITFDKSTFKIIEL